MYGQGTGVGVGAGAGAGGKTWTKPHTDPIFKGLDKKTLDYYF
jgi:hypothetical protein